MSREKKENNKKKGHKIAIDEAKDFTPTDEQKEKIKILCEKLKQVEPLADEPDYLTSNDMYEFNR